MPQRQHILVALACVIGLAGCSSEYDAFNNETDEFEFGSSQSHLTKGSGGTNGVDPDFCDDPGNECVQGEGDCDVDSHCAGALVCLQNNGAQFGFAPNFDICTPVHCGNSVLDGDETEVDCGGSCGATCGDVCDSVPASPDASACTELCPCPAGEGDCDGSAQCVAGTTCVADVGASYGMPANYDVCVTDHCSNGVMDGDETGVDCGGADCTSCAGVDCSGQPANPSPDRCSAACPCPAAESDCDADNECNAGLACGTDNGTPFGYPSNYDVCVAPHCMNGVMDADETVVDCGGADCGSTCAPPACEGQPASGHPDRCSAECPCADYDGDCDNDAECMGICRQNVGKEYGFAPAIDVCVPATCGNGVMDGGETAMDCGGPCPRCTFTMDLRTDTMDRTLLGNRSSDSLANVVIGDFNNDGTNDVVVAAANTPVGFAPERTLAGAVYGYTGGAAFLNSATTTAPAGATFRVLGAEAGDYLGGVNSRMAVVDVTGDGVEDLVVSAYAADGAGNARVQSGEVYVFSGALTGDIDLGAMMPPTQLTATFYGEAAGDKLTLLDVVDVTGDGVADIIMGAIWNDTAGVDAGAVYVFPGGAGVTGAIDFNGATSAFVFRGAAGDRLGVSAAGGNLGGSSAADLVIASSQASPGARTRAGAAWIFHGPIVAGAVVGAANSTILGGTRFDYLGRSIAIANVTGTATPELILGAPQFANSAGARSGGVLMYVDGVSAGLHDLSVNMDADVVFEGRDNVDFFGNSLTTGNMDADGYQDLMLAAPQADRLGNTGTRNGEIYVYMGCPSFPAIVNTATETPQFTLYGDGNGDLLGQVRGANAMGDINGDGKDDLCASSYLFDSAFANAGRVDCWRSRF